jgi:hypothetical protein
MGLIPLLATLVPPETIAAQLTKLDLLKGIRQAGGAVVYPFGWDPTHTRLPI